MTAEKKAFIITSFKDNYNHVYHTAIKPALQTCGYHPVRADDTPLPGNAPEEVIRSIISADIVVAEISEESANIFYELGVSHCTGNKTITVASDSSGLPFDLRTYRTLLYSPDERGLKLLKSDLVTAIKALEAHGMTRPNNLVQEAGRDFFDLRTQIRENLKEIAAEKERMRAFADFLDRGNKEQDNTGVADRVAQEILRQLPTPAHRLLACIAGPGAIGKSTFARLVRKRVRNLSDKKVRVSILPTDAYQLSRAERLHRNIIGFDPRSHNLQRLLSDVEDLLSGKSVSVTPYDHKSGDHLAATKVEAADVIILEGVYSFLPTLTSLNRGLKFFIYADRHKAKELKFIADIRTRSYDLQTAFSHSEAEYRAYEDHILPLLRIADFVIDVDEYWRYRDPEPKKLRKAESWAHAG